MIPKTFKMVNRTWRVRLVTTKQLQKHLDNHYPDEEVTASEIMGLCDQRAARIFLNKDKHTEREALEHTYCHEFVHCLKYANGEEIHDEQEVDRLGGYLHQALQTSTGEI